MTLEELDLTTKIRLLSGSDFWHTEALEELDLERLTLSDGPHGLRVQADSADHLSLGNSLPATCFPTAVTLASTWDEDLVGKIGAALGAEARASDVDVVLGPGLNLKRHPAGGRNFEYFSEDPLLSGKIASAVVRGIQSRGVAACPKHFAVNNQERARMRIDAIVDERTLRELYLRGFEIVVTEANPWVMMSAYNRINGEHAGESRWLLTEVLRDEWGFDGLVVSDWYATFDRPRGVRAGLDLEMPGSKGTWDRAVAEAVARGELSVEDVDRACRRLMRLSERVADTGPGRSREVLHDEHHALARRAAAAGTVLLTNDGTLPLDEGLSVGVVGAFAAEPRYQGGGSSRVNPTRVETPLDSLRARLGGVAYASGYDEVTGVSEEGQIAEAVALARECDVVVLVVGLPTIVESEGWDRDDLALPSDMDRLVERMCDENPRTVVVLQNGAPVTMPWARRPAAVVEAWLGGQAGGAALTDVLVGDVEPGGRLSESFPVQASQLPADANFANHATQVVHREGLYVGYRFHDTFDVSPAFPFGHGLGYTTWEWGDVTVEGDGVDRTVRASLTNTGERRGSQVVQLYVHAAEPTVHRPAQELKGFAKVTLDPGESTEVAIELDRRSFAIWDVGGGAWMVESGTYELRLGASSRDIRGTVAVEIDSEDVVTPVAPPRGPVMTDAELAAILGHPVPAPPPLLPFHRDTLIDDLDQTVAGRTLQTLLDLAQRHQLPEPPDEETRRLIEAALREAPLRVLAAGVGGPWALRVADGVIRALNLFGRLSS